MTGWFVSRVWSANLKTWLAQRYCARWELPIRDGRRLDAALWSQPTRNGPMDIALEWEWDNTKVADAFAYGDFRKVLAVEARCGLAIVQTRADGKRGPTQADETIRALVSCCRDHRQDGRSIAVIEIRRVRQTANEVEFICALHDLDTIASREIARWLYR